MLFCPLCPVVSVSLPRGDSGDCEWICDLVADVGSAVLLLQFFQSRSVWVNYGPSVRRPLYWPFQQPLSRSFSPANFFLSGFKVQCVKFLQDAPIARLCLNSSGKAEEQPRFFMVHLWSSVVYFPPFYLLPRPFRHHCGGCDLRGARRWFTPWH